MVLLIFNQKKEIKYGEILELIKIPPKELMTHMHSLIAKYKILKKEKAGPLVPNETLSVNKDFNSLQIRITTALGIEKKEKEEINT
jgi:hypothetical protein